MVSRFNKLFYYMSDIHLEKRYSRIFNINKNFRERPYLILLGDIGYVHENSYREFLYGMSERFDKIFLIAGNHEYDGKKNVKEVNLEIENICQVKNNLIFLQQKTFKVCDKNNIILAGCTLWSKLPKSKYEYHLEDKKWLYNTIKNNPKNNYIVATHHCPLFECLNTKDYLTANYFVSDQSKIIKENNLLMWIHGHSHLNKDMNISNKWILSNQYGSYNKPLWKFNENK